MTTRTRPTTHSLADLLSDAENIVNLPQDAQERTIAALRQEIEIAKTKLNTVQQTGSTQNPYDVQTAQTVMGALSQARQSCPTCRAAQMPMPSFPPQTFGNAPMYAPTMIHNPVMSPPMPMPLSGMYYGGMTGLDDELRKGARDVSVVGGNVRALQNALNVVSGQQNVGMNTMYGNEIISVQTTGVFDDQTERAVKLFQKQRSLPQTGVADQTTLNALGVRLSTTSVSAQTSASAGASVSAEAKIAPSNPKSSATLRLQQLLKAAGYSVATDGIFGAKTEAALKKFQSAVGLAATGQANDAVLAKLQEEAGKRSGATARAEAGKNTIPTTREKAAPILETGLRVGVPLVAGGVAGFASWKSLRETNKQKKGVYAAAIGAGTALITFIGTNLLADSITAVTPEQQQ